MTEQQLPTIVETRLLSGTSQVAILLDNGHLVINSPENGIETALSATSAYDLLLLLYNHRDLLYRIAYGAPR